MFNINKFRSEIVSMIIKANAHAKLYGWFTSVELILGLLVAVLFWCGVCFIINGESLIEARLYVFTLPIYGMIRVFLHMTGKLRIPFID